MTSVIRLTEHLAPVLNESDFGAQQARRQASEALEVAREMALIGKSRLGRYFRQRMALADQPLRFANSDLDEIAVRRHSDGSAESSNQIGPIEVSQTDKLGKFRPFTVSAIEI